MRKPLADFLNIAIPKEGLAGRSESNLRDFCFNLKWLWTWTRSPVQKLNWLYQQKSTWIYQNLPINSSCTDFVFGVVAKLWITQLVVAVSTLLQSLLIKIQIIKIILVWCQDDIECSLFSKCGRQSTISQESVATHSTIELQNKLQFAMSIAFLWRLVSSIFSIHQ